MRYKLSLLTVLLVMMPAACKERDSSQLSDADVRDGEGRIQVIGARKGVVMYRLCSHEDQKKWTERGAQGAYLEDCTQPDGFPDIPTEDYKKLLCDSYQYDEAALKESIEIRDGAAKLYGIWKKKADAIQAQLDGQSSGGNIQDITVFGQQDNGQQVDREELLRQLEPTKKQEADQKKILDEHQAKIDQHNGAKNTCDTLMNDVVLPQKDKQDSTLEIPRIVPMYPSSPEYAHLMAPFKIWKAKNSKQEQIQKQQEEQEAKKKDDAIQEQKAPRQIKVTVDAITGKYSSHCNLTTLNGPSYSTPQWKSYFESQCRSECGNNSMGCGSWKHASAIYNGSACVISIEVKCE